MPLLITRGLGSGAGLILQGLGNLGAPPPNQGPVYVDPRRPEDLLLERGIKFANVPKGRSDFARRGGSSGPSAGRPTVFGGVAIFEMTNGPQGPSESPVSSNVGFNTLNGAIKFRFRSYKSSIPSSINIGPSDFIFPFTGPPAPVLIPQGHILDGSTEALWRLDEGLSTANLIDIANGHTVMQFHSPPAIVGQIDGARYLTGSSNGAGNTDPNLRYFQGVGNASMGSCFNGDWTIEQWINPDRHPASSNIFIYNGLDFSFDNNHTIMAETQYDVTNYPNGLTGSFLFHQWHNPSTFTAMSSSARLTSGSWAHVAISRTAQGGNLHTFRLYVNGQLDSTFPNIAGMDFVISGSGHFIGFGNFIGATGFGIGVGNPFTGKIDDSRISRVARTSAEVLESYRRGHPT